jgi:hypothetical protein
MLNPKSFGFAAGIIWGVAIFAWTFVALATGLWLNFMNAVGWLYPGYSVSVPGAFIGLVYGFFDAGILFYAFAWLYNLLEAKGKK